jgi:hypothetical protein
MAMHLAVWSGAKTDSTANEAAPAVADNVLTRTANGNQYLAPFNGLILMGFALNDTITRARYNYPSMRNLGLPEIFPVTALAEPSADFQVFRPGMNGPRFRKNEELGAESSNGASTVDTIHIGALLCDVMKPVPAGTRFTVTGTAAQTLIASAWTSAAVALDQTLPFGRYAVIGMAATCNDGIAARLIFPNSDGFRPGVPVGETNIITDYEQSGRYGAWGEWGRFEQTAPPQLEVLGGTAGAETPRVYLDLVALDVMPTGG